MEREPHLNPSSRTQATAQGDPTSQADATLWKAFADFLDARHISPRRAAGIKSGSSDASNFTPYFTPHCLRAGFPGSNPRPISTACEPSKLPIGRSPRRSKPSRSSTLFSIWLIPPRRTQRRRTLRSRTRKHKALFQVLSKTPSPHPRVLVVFRPQ